MEVREMRKRKARRLLNITAPRPEGIWYFLQYQILHGAEQCPEKLLHHELGSPKQREWAIFKDFISIFPALFKEILHMYVELKKKKSHNEK